MILRPGNAGSNTTADHIQVVRDALKQLPAGHRSGRKVMIRTDSAGGTHEFLHWLTAGHRNLGYSVGFPIHGAVGNVLPLIPQKAWTRAYNSDGEERDGAWVADITGMLDLSAWPKGLRVIVRKEIPHPGAQLRITDIDGMRYTAFATNQARGQLADLEVRDRLRARCEDRIRGAKDSGRLKPALALFCGEHDLVPPGHARHRTHGMGADACLRRHPCAAVGAQETPGQDLRGRGENQPPRQTAHRSSGSLGPRHDPADQRPHQAQDHHPAIASQTTTNQQRKRNSGAAVEPPAPSRHGQRPPCRTLTPKSDQSGSQ